MVQVIDESNGEIVSTIRIKGTTYRPKVFRKGTYTVKVGDEKWLKTRKGVKSLGPNQRRELKIEL